MGASFVSTFMAVDAFGLPREEILFVAFAGWDVAGARWFGGRPGRAGRDLADLVRFVSASH